MQIPGLSVESSLIVVVVFAAVIVFAIVVIGYAIVVRRRRRARHLAGPGNPNVPPTADPWRRFAMALAAPYARYEWKLARGGANRHNAEQTYFGYGVCQPWGVTGNALRRDWGVRNEATASARLEDAEGAVVIGIRNLLIADERIDPSLVRERAARLGLAMPVIDGIDPEVCAEIRATEGAGSADVDVLRDQLAFDIGRFANLLRWVAYVGLVTEERANGYGDVFATVAAIAFDSWGEYGQRYLAGLRASKFRGHRARVKAVEWLMADPSSPWHQARWPA